VALLAHEVYADDRTERLITYVYDLHGQECQRPNENKISCGYQSRD
jgi:hypothetical protein